MSAKSRYLEEVPNLTAPVATALVNVWCGFEEETDGLGAQSERLELFADGTFEHSLGHTLTRSRQTDLREPTESTCSGRWRLYKVRHLGADVDAAGDREIAFELGPGSTPLHQSRMVVCGQNPVVNGFHGAACRLYPEASSQGRDSATKRRRQGEPAAQQEDTDPGVELEVVGRPPTDAEVRTLTEATGRPSDECYAALLQYGGLEEAAIRLLEDGGDGDGEQEPEAEQGGGGPGALAASKGQPPSTGGGGGRGGGGTVSSTMAQVMAYEQNEEKHVEISLEDARALVEATGRSLESCREALEAQGGRVDAAAEYLLGLPESGGDSGGSSSSSSSSSSPASRSSYVGSPPQEAKATAVAGDGCEAAALAAGGEEKSGEEELGAARRLAEMCERPLEECLEALRAAGGRAEEAAGRLLGLDGGAEEPPASPPPAKRQRSEKESSDVDEDIFDDLFTSDSPQDLARDSPESTSPAPVPPPSPVDGASVALGSASVA